MSVVNIAMVTTSRADYGLLKPLWSVLKGAVDFNVTMLVTGSHLLESQGYTYRHIKTEGVSPIVKVDMKIQSDSDKDLAQGVANGLSGFSKVFSEYDFDLLIVLGDRFELLSACNAALLHRLPIAHLHGGEITIGVIDEAIRHSITKMSALHFVAHEDYRRRVIQLGEQPASVFNVGAIGLDNFDMNQACSKRELENKTGLDFSSPILLLTFHPVTLDDQQSLVTQAGQLFKALEAMSYQVLVTMTNADMGGNIISQRCQLSQERFPEKFKVVSSLGTKAYIAAMKYSAVMIGNSSSGILEAASFKLPVVNIGDRQLGRVKPDNVLDTPCEENAIKQTVEKAMSTAFKVRMESLRNPFGTGHTAEKIMGVLRKTDLKNREKLLKKYFYDLPITY